MPPYGTPNRKRRRSSGGGGRALVRKSRSRFRRSSTSFPSFANQRVHRMERWGSEFIFADNGAGSADGNGTTGWSFSGPTADLGLNSVQAGLAADFQLNALQDYTEFTNLFDSYQIEKVELHITYLNNSATPGVAIGTPSGQYTGTQLPTIMHVADYDDATAPANLTVIQEFGSSKTARLDKPIVVTVRPRVARQVFQGVTVGYETPKASTWINCDYATVQHYSWKAWISNFPVSSLTGSYNVSPVSVLKIQPKYFLAFKQTR